MSKTFITVPAATKGPQGATGYGPRGYTGAPGTPGTTGPSFVIGNLDGGGASAVPSGVGIGPLDGGGA